jgi:hypothetical protein
MVFNDAVRICDIDHDDNFTSFGSNIFITKSSIFWDMSCTSLKVNRRFGGAFTAAYFMLVSCLAYSSTLKMEAPYSTEKSVGFQRTTRRYNPEENPS